MTIDNNQTAGSDEPIHPVTPVTVRIPDGMLRDYDAEVVRGLYADREAALLDALVTGWRHHRGRYSTLRVDIGLPDPHRSRADTEGIDLGDLAAALAPEEADSRSVGKP